MKRPILILICITMALVGLAQDGSSTGPETLDSLSLKERIFYHYDRSEFTEVVNACNKALEVYKATDDFFEMAGCYSILGIAYQRLGRYKEAIESYERSTEVLEKMKESEIALHKEGAEAFYDKNIRYTRNNMAEIYFAMGDYGESEKLYLKCLEMLGTPHDTIDYLDQALYLENLSIVGLKQAATLEDTEKTVRQATSVKQAEEAMSLSTQYGDPPFKHVSKMITLAQAYHAVGRIEEAMTLANEALGIAEMLGDPYLLAEINDVHGEFNAYAGHYEEAEKHYRQAAIIATENHFDELQLSSLAGAYEAARHFDKGLALDYLEQSDALKDSVFNEQQQQLIRDYQVKYDLAEKDHKLAIQEERNHHSRTMVFLLFALTILLIGLLILAMRFGHIRKQQNKALAKLNKTRNHMFSVVSHDLKTSVMSQNLMLDVMESHFDEMTKDDVYAKVLILKASSDGLKEKMLNLIEWMKMGMGNNKIQTTTFDLHALVEDCIESQKTEIDKKRLTVVNAAAPSLMANDDANMVQLVLRNLLNNAVKFSWPDGEIRIDATKENGKIWMTVTDHGIGISAERQKCLLNDMVAPSQGTQGETGSGIGLMLCKQLISRNGGKITVKSQVGNGTTIQFSINPL